MNERLALTVNEATKSIGLGKTRVYEEIAAGRLRARKAGKRTLILKSDLERFLENLPALGENRL